MKKCPRCNQIKEIGPNKARYDGLAIYCKECLSKIHLEKYPKTLTRKQCPICGSIFEGFKNKKLCNGCRGVNTRKPITGYKKCLICSKEFPYRDTLLVRGGGGVACVKAKFCSRKCSDKATIERNKVWRPSEEIKKKLARLAVERFTGVKQTDKQRQWQSDIRKGEKSYFWKGGVCNKNKLIRSSYDFTKWREAVFTRDNWTCQRCGQRGVKLQAHHIKKFVNFPELRLDVNNGQTLCISCHKLTDNYANKQ